jgi:hypothetical protein
MSVSESVTVEQAIAILKQLSPRDQLKVIAQVLPEAEQRLSDDEQKPLRSLKGLWADLGPAPSAEEIDEARREMWGNFPRDDF